MDIEFIFYPEMN